MDTIKLNNTEMSITAYNRNTYFSEGGITSTANCSVLVDDLDNLNAIAQDTITSIQIYHDNTLIYDLQDIEAYIESINEYLNGDRMDVGVNLVFSFESNT